MYLLLPGYSKYLISRTILMFITTAKCIWTLLVFDDLETVENEYFIQFYVRDVNIVVYVQ